MSQATRKRASATATGRKGAAAKPATGKTSGRTGAKDGARAAGKSRSKSKTAGKTGGRIAKRTATAVRGTAAGRVDGRGGNGTARPPAQARTRLRTPATATFANTVALGHMGRLLREVGAIVCVFAALIALLALATFHVEDPGWSHTGANTDIVNSVGRAGAWFADVTFYVLGYMAYLVPLILGVSGWLLFRDERRSQDTYRPFVFVRVIGIALMLVSASGLADLHFGVSDGALPRGTFGGGILGTAVAWRLVAYLHHQGTTLLLLACFFCSMTLAFGTSWLELVESIGAALVRGVDRVRGLFDGRAEARAERERQEAADEVRQSRYAEAEPGATDVLTGETSLSAPMIPLDGDAAPRRGLGGAVGGMFGALGRRLTRAAVAVRRVVDGPDLADYVGAPAGASGPRPDEFAASLDEADALLAERRGGPAFGRIRARADGAAGRGASSSARAAAHEADPFDRPFETAVDPSFDRESDVRSEPAPKSALKPRPGAVQSATGEGMDEPLGEGGAPIARTAPRPSSAARLQATSADALVAPPGSSADSAEHAAAAVEARKKKIAIKQRVITDDRQSKLYLDIPDTDLPPLSLLDPPAPQTAGFTPAELESLSLLLEQKLAEFRIQVEVVAVQPGPVITRFEMELAPGIKASRVSGLAQDIARSLSLVSVRVVEVIPGKSTIGIEVPNKSKEMVCLSEMLMSQEFVSEKSPLTLALGKDISGQAVTADLGKMPHLLVAGTTGSGKSVGVNSMLISLLYKATAKDVRLILIDPKMLELNVYEGIPHLLTPVVTDMKEAANALRWSVGEMERRYALMAACKVRNIAGYNKKVKEAIAKGEPLPDPLWVAELSLNPSGPPPTLEPMPWIVIVVDEFADMMMQVGKKAEELISRIAAKARAAGIHMVLATQRPSVDVITGLIKANVPSRIAFQVSSKIDSRTILDTGGAESLLGHGDMLFQPVSRPMERVHGAFVDDHEVQNVVAWIKQTGEPNYIEEILQESNVAIPGLSGGDEGSGEGGESDALYDQAVAIVAESRRASISFVQRKLKIGYNRAARMIEEMESAGVVTPDMNGKREVLVPPPS